MDRFEVVRRDDGYWIEAIDDSGFRTKVKCYPTEATALYRIAMLQAGAEMIEARNAYLRRKRT